MIHRILVLLLGALALQEIAAQPANDTCAAAATLPLERGVAGTTAGAANDTQLSGAACFTGLGQTPSTAAGRDVTYVFQAPAAGAYSFRATGYASSGNLVLYVAADCPAGMPPLTIGACLGAANRGAGTPAEEAPCLALSSGQTVFVYVDETAPSPGGSTFLIEASRCAAETEPNPTPAAAVAPACGLEGSIGSAADVDFFHLGTPASGSRVFALVDGVAAASTDLDLRVTTAADTLEYDDQDLDVPFGALSPTVEGRAVAGGPAYLRVSHKLATTAAGPYRLYAAVQPSSASASLESEPNDLPAQADTAPNRYHRGALASPADVDLFAFTAQPGDLVVLGLDADPLRDLTPANLALALLDGAGMVLASVNDASVTSSNAPGTGSLTATTPFSPGEGLTWRVNVSGTYLARVTGATGDYLLSIALGCRVLPATDVALTGQGSPPCAASGQQVTYAFQVANTGASPARNVVLTDPLPGAVALVSAVPSQGSCAGSTTVTCHLGDLAPFATATVTIVVTAGTGGPISNTATVRSDVADGNPGNDADTVDTNGGCNDGNACTTGDACVGGTCTGGPPPSCDDTNPCTDDACVATSGCTHTPNSAPCDDGNPCTTPDVCAGGACTGGPPPSCDDSNPCTDDACVPAAGCTHTPNTVPCSDGNTCSAGDVCQGGACVSGACTGTCTGNAECVEDLDGTCLCVPGAVTCGGTGPSCEGECPAGGGCAFDASQGACVCQPGPACGTADAPLCEAVCPSGLRCELDETGPTAACSCQPPEVDCEVSGAPVCGGECETGYVCQPAGTECVCAPSTPACGTAGAPACAGACPAGQYCRPATVGGPCTCVAQDTPCGSAAAPACDGRCPDDQQCVAGTGGVCLCQPVLCGQAASPECGGACPPGEICRHDASLGACACEPDDVPCGQSAPECGGGCPPGQVCETGPTGSTCVCIQEPVPCGAASAPACNGECPGDDVCVDGPAGCACQPPVLDCGSSAVPACGGNCPDGERCQEAIVGDVCECKPFPPACGNADAPLCNGDCPIGAQCFPTGSNDECACVVCGVAVPGNDLTLLWSGKNVFEWSPLSCATSYGVYRKVAVRLTDSDANGAADDHGTCLASGLTVREVQDSSIPPPGLVHFYLLAGRNAVGEGGLGHTKSGLPRVNAFPCP